MNKYKVTQAEKEAAHAIARRAARRAWNNIHGVEEVVTTKRSVPSGHKPKSTHGITLAGDMAALGF